MMLSFGLSKMRYFVKNMFIKIEGGCQDIL
jgi:hypothetical protein